MICLTLFSILLNLNSSLSAFMQHHPLSVMGEISQLKVLQFSLNVKNNSIERINVFIMYSNNWDRN